MPTTERLILDGLGHLFYLLIFLGMVMISKKHEVGWLLRLAGETGWAVLGLYMGLTSIWIWAVPFIYIDTKGYLLWRKLKTKL
jgi:hypothetical protein